MQRLGPQDIGVLLLRDVASGKRTSELAAFLPDSDLPVVEVFLETDLGHHQRIDAKEPGQKIVRTIYGRGPRSIFWSMHFLKHYRDYPFQTLRYGKERDHIGDLLVPEGIGPFPVVMLVHGGFWRDSYYRDSTLGIAADLAQRGIAGWNIEYRRVGPSGGGYPETQEDILNALNHLKELAGSHPLDLTSVAVIGHSAGGYLSIWGSSIPTGLLATIMPEPQVPVQLGISLAGVTDLDEAHKSGGGDKAATHFLKGAAENPELRKQLSAAYLNYAKSTQLILAHGTLDEYVPVELSEYTYDLLKEKKENIDLVVYPETGHNEFVDPDSSAWQDIASRVCEILDVRFSVSEP